MLQTSYQVQTDTHRAPLTICAVIALYNGAPFIREALESVFAQTQPPSEIIVVDDGSTDGGADIVRALSATRAVTLLSKPNGGQSSARNMAIHHTTCSHVAFLDQDDTWYPQHLEVLAKAFSGGTIPQLALVYGNLDTMDRNGGWMGFSVLDDHASPHPKRRLADCLSIDMMILPSASLVAREAILAAGGFDERLSGYEDDDLFLRMFRAGYRSAYVNRSVTRWRIYAGSTSSTDRMKDSRLIYFRKLLAMFPDEERLHLHWRRDTFGSRFFNAVRREFLAAWDAGDDAAMTRAVYDLSVLLPALAYPFTARVRRSWPVVRALKAAGLVRPAMYVLKNALARS
jgi:glycosyltransferase involved in cell wall biosynthesis